MALQALLAQNAVSTFWLSLGLTYVAHAAIWAAVAALGARSQRLSFAARHGCWKAALFGPLLSAVLASAWSGARWAGETVSPPSLTATSSHVAVSVAPAAAPPARLPQLELSVRSATPNAVGLVWLALAAGGLGLLRFGASVTALRRILRGRRGVTEARIVGRFEALRARVPLSNVRLTECERLPSPLVIGRREVCVPLGVLSSLSDDDLDAVFAHELAHIERGDGIWFPLVGAVQYTLWFQPLNHLVSSYFRTSAELSCDDRAVQLTQNPKALGRALVRLAEAASSLPGPVLAPSIVRKESFLLPRVRRLAAASAGDDCSSARHGNWIAFASVALVGIALVTLSVQIVRAQPAVAPAVTRQVAPAPAARLSEALTPPPSVAEQSLRMAELAGRDQQLTAALAQLSKNPAAAREGTPEFTRGLELSQDLNHVRATQAWVEERFVAASASGEQR